MTDAPPPIIERSSALYRNLAELLDDIPREDTPRAILAESVARIAMEHGFAICLLMPAGTTTTTIALLRIQYEAVVRALWLYFAAHDAWIDKFALAIDGKQLGYSDLPSISTMLTHLEMSDAPPSIAQMLGALKSGAWGPMNSYVHTGVIPVLTLLHGHADSTSEDNLRNANGLTGMVAMLIAFMSGDGRLTRAVRDLQLAHLDCLPPLLPNDPRPEPRV